MDFDIQIFHYEPNKSRSTLGGSNIALEQVLLPYQVHKGQLSWTLVQVEALGEEVEKI